MNGNFWRAYSSLGRSGNISLAAGVSSYLAKGVYVVFQQTSHLCGLEGLSAVLCGVVLLFPTRAPKNVVSLHRFSKLARNLERRCTLIINLHKTSAI